MTRLRLGILSALFACVVGCAPRLSYDGRLVRVVDDFEAVQCRHLSSSTITLGRMEVFLRRAPGKQIVLLRTAARNLAAEIGADHVVPLGAPENNAQSFKFYICND